MKTRFLATALVLLAAFAATSRADEFSDLAHSPNAYWVPPTVTYAPPPVYYYAPPPPPIVGGVFFHFHIH